MKLVKPVLARLGATVAGTLYVTLCLRMGSQSARDSEPAATLYLLLILAVLLLLVSAIASLSEWVSRPNILSFLVGTAIGVTYDALSDKTTDRNLFPIEIILWCAMFSVALVAGKRFGEWRKRKQIVSPD
jgi:CDP-diglyceride synthetase